MNAYGRAALGLFVCMAISSGVRAQALEGDWRGNGACGSTSVDNYSINLSIRGTTVTGTATSFGQKSRDGVDGYRFEGTVNANTGSVSLVGSPSGSNRYEGTVNSGKMSITGWNGYSTCTYTLAATATPASPPTSTSGPANSTTIPHTARGTDVAAPAGAASQAPQSVGPSIPETSQEIVAQQRSLSLLGHYNGSIDGVYGPATRASIESWQRANGMVASGRLAADQGNQLKNQALAAMSGNRAPEAVSTVPPKVRSNPPDPATVQQMAPTSSLSPPVPVGHVFRLSVRGASRTVVRSDRQEQIVRIEYRLTEANASEACRREEPANHRTCVREYLGNNNAPELLFVDCSTSTITFRGEPYRKGDMGDFWWGPKSANTSPFIRADDIFLVACKKSPRP